jgi:hypothetical protein
VSPSSVDSESPSSLNVGMRSLRVLGGRHCPRANDGQ